MTDDPRTIHQYGPIHDDYGHHIGYGCIEDHEAWPCRVLMALGGHTGNPPTPRPIIRGRKNA